MGIFITADVDMGITTSQVLEDMGIVQGILE
jgi:hypothetical protein